MRKMRSGAAFIFRSTPYFDAQFYEKLSPQFLSKVKKNLKNEVYKVPQSPADANANGAIPAPRPNVLQI